jgi:hypothetical protein
VPLAPDKLERILYGTTLPDAHTKQRLEQERSNNMPDIRTALQAALTKQEKLMDINTLNEWDKGTADSKAEQGAAIKTNEPPSPKAAKNLSRTLFNYVRDNPGVQFTKIREALSSYKTTSTASLLTQMVRQGVVRCEGTPMHYTYYATATEYKPLQARKKAARQEKLRKKLVIIRKKGIVGGDPIPLNAPAGLAALKADTRQVSGTHYKDMPIQPWSVMESVLTKEEFIGFLKGNIIKYSMRAGRKEGSDDTGKAQHYQQKLREIENT